mgnify:CR=1 FL=1
MVDISIPKPDFEKDRGQVGIESLVVFIAMILVAALAAGVLINTAGFLQNKATSTSHESQQQVSDRVTVISATGTVNNTSDTNYNKTVDWFDSNRTIDHVEISVMASPGSDEIDLSQSTIQWVGPDGATTITYDNSNYTVIPVKDDDKSSPVLNDRSDRFKLALDLSLKQNSTMQALEGGEDATVHIVTASGTRTTYILNVPQSLSSASEGEAVSL